VREDSCGGVSFFFPPVSPSKIPRMNPTRLDSCKLLTLGRVMDLLTTPSSSSPPWACPWPSLLFERLGLVEI
jgi:hypothetical protein